MNNKLFIPVKNYENKIGGPSTFIFNLKNFLDEKNFFYTNSATDADVIFFPISFRRDLLYRHKLKKGKIVQRLDGVFYPSKHGKRYLLLNREIKKIYQGFADYIVFQSDYSKNQCFEMFGLKSENQYEIIINGVDKKIFYPSNNIIPSETFKFITTGNFRNEDMVVPIIKALDSLKDKIKFKLIIVGPIKENFRDLIDREYIEYVGKKTLNETADFLRHSHIFLYSHLNPPCPNSVIEAISCGLPVVGFKSGSMEELLPFSKELLAYVSDDLFQEYKDFDESKLSEKILKCVNNYDYYKKNALENSKLYSFEECGEKYLNVFEKILSNTTLKPFEAKDYLKIFFNNIYFIFEKVIYEARIRFSNYFNI